MMAISQKLVVKDAQNVHKHLQACMDNAGGH